MKKQKKKSKWQAKREQEASQNSQFDPKIHDLGRAGFGFQMKKDYKSKIFCWKCRNNLSSS